MRAIAVALMLMSGGCERAPSAGEPAQAIAEQVAFDGAAAVEASAKLAQGERLSWVLGCRGCHGKDLTGEIWDDDPKGYGVMWASNLTRAVPAMTDAQLTELLVAGVHPRRPELWLMPSQIFQHLGQRDLEALIAHLRSVKPVGDVSPDPVLGPRALAEAKSGKVKPAAVLVKELKGVQPADLGPDHALGRYISKLTCAECHGPQLKGHEGDTPDLVVAGGYSRDEFERLITEGVPTGGRKLKPLMQSVSKNRFSKLTANERDALYSYLKALAEQPSN